MPVFRSAGSVRGCFRVLNGIVFASIIGCHHASPVRTGGSTAEGSTTARSRAQTLTVDSTTRTVTHVEELLIGRFPGVHVRRTPSGGFSVRVGGPNSFISNEEPLYIIDGTPVNVAPDRGLYWLSPADVARIEVLKDPATTSMYGVRGANGVIKITTKRP